MAVVKELLRAEADGSLSFGNYELDQKTKVSDFEFGGDIYKVKTFKEITKLERNEMLVYESDPGTAVTHFKETGDGASFDLDTPEDSQVILGLEENTEYRVKVTGQEDTVVKTSAGGKLVLSVEAKGQPVSVMVEKI